MSLRYKILLALTAVMILILGILTFHLWITAWGRVQTNQRGMAELLKSITQDWLAEVQTAQDWETLKTKLNYSTLFTNWVIVDSNLAPIISAAPISDPDTFKKDRYIADVFKTRQPVFREGYVIAPLLMQDKYLAIKMKIEPLAGLDFNPIESVKTILLVMPLGTFVLILSMYILLTKLVLRPIELLSKASHEISKGNYETQLPLMTGNDEIAHLINTFDVMSKELSEYHRDLEGKIQEAREKIEATEAQLIVAQRLSATGTLAAGIAHEINNPLGGILNAAMSLKKGTLSKEQSQQYMELIIDGLNRIQDILKKVLQSFSHKVTTQPLDLKIIIERAILLIKHRLDEHKIAIANTLPLYIPQVFGDSTELQQVFLNLLMNAIDAITADKTRIPDRKIEVFHEMAPERHGDGGATDEKTITVCIRDNGAGISEDALGRAFDMFYTTKEPGKGTGLGLSVAYNIVHNHGGKISLHRNKEKGTIAKVSLPVLRQKMETMVGK